MSSKIFRHAVFTLSTCSLFLLSLSATISPSLLLAQPYDAKYFQELRWRCIGPFRAGRTVGAVGVPSQPGVFYVGVNNGGVWKTGDYGRTWNPIFDQEPTGSVGDVAVAQSDPNIIYVGSGEGIQRPDLSVGDGVYKSTDGGKTWTNTGLKDGEQIGSVVVDPHDANRVFVAVLGHPYGANVERGVYRSTNGGAAWQKVLYKDENTGAVQVGFNPLNTQTVYADLWAARQGPWENGAWQGPASGLFKSTDGGSTWRQLTDGLPTTAQHLGRIGFTVAPSDSNRLYATVDAQDLGGIYRSDDGGEHWRRTNSEARLWGRGDDFAEVKVHPKNPDIVYVANTSTYRSTDGGNSFLAFKGSPGGDDYHRIWINPDDPRIMLLGVDQGAIVTVNEGETWSSWYNQPTAQFYHVVTDNRFPYWVYGGQQESGSAGVASRGDYGAITWRDWQTIGVEEYGYVAPDPLNPNLIYGGKITRFDRTTSQVQTVSPEAVRSGKYRFLRTAPVIFSPVEPHLLYFAGNVLFKTTTGGDSWEVISPDLSREKPDVPASIGVYRTAEMETMQRRGVIYTVAPSFRNVDIIWAGTDDGLMYVTRDGGKNWTNVTPPQLTPWSKVSLMVASHFDDETAYAAVNRIRLDDLRPHIYRTHDGGKTWKEIVDGIPDNEVTNAVREDRERKGLLFAGTERAVYVSFDDGDHWQSLKMNMPATSIRDLVIHDNDLVLGTHGRSFWIMDDIAPLRELSSSVSDSRAHLFKPAAAYRIRRSTNTDTPIPPDEPMGENPPDGAMLDYALHSASPEPVVLEIFDKANKLVRRFSSADQPEVINEKDLTVMTAWVRPPRVLATSAGMHRFVWDLHYAAPEGAPRSIPISAIFHDTPSEPMGPSVLPGVYKVRLTAGKDTMTESLTVKMDPRVKATSRDLAKAFSMSMQCYEGYAATNVALEKLRSIQSQSKSIGEKTSDRIVKDSLDAFESRLNALGGTGTPRRGRFGRDEGEMNLTRLNGRELALMELVEEADAAPTTQAVKAIAESGEELKLLTARWNQVLEKDLKRLNDLLRKTGLGGISPGREKSQEGMQNRNKDED